jgi:rSAM/selenodomain-associated transferase 1
VRGAAGRYRYPQSRLLIFAKAPIPGRSKTRLAGKLGARGAARLQARLTRHALRTAVRSRLAPLQLWCAPDSTHGFFAACRRDHPLTLHRQHGADLGRRMHHALTRALRGSGSAVLIGSDCPALTPAVLNNAFAALRDGADVVLVPALDGGYVLVGVRRSAARLFHAIGWGGARVLAQTRRRLRQLKLTCVELPALGDVDTPADFLMMKRSGLL